MRDLNEDRDFFQYQEVSQIYPGFLCQLDFLSVMKTELPYIDVFSDNFSIPEEYESPGIVILGQRNRNHESFIK